MTPVRVRVLRHHRNEHAWYDVAEFTPKGGGFSKNRQPPAGIHKGYNGTIMATFPIPAQSVPAPRIQSVDALRGAIMMLMAIDHIRDYVARSAQQFLPTDLKRTTPAIFFTRRITQFCAPVFMLTAGFGAYFWMSRGHHSKGELSRLLTSRGIWLIVLEVTILRLIFFSQISFTVNPVILIILWAIGISMIGLAGLIYLPMRVIAAVSIAIIALHNLLDHVSAERFGRAAWIWDILHQQNVFACG
jgi:uncharacterized membrane protein